jgi:hypothetical protein
MPTNQSNVPRPISGRQGRRNLSDSVTRGLCAALALKELPLSFDNDVALALKKYRGASGAPKIALQQIEAVERVADAVAKLQLAMRRADAALELTAPAVWAPRTWTTFIPTAWRDAEPTLIEMHERLVAWLAARKMAPRARGAPHDGRFHLRIAIFQTLQQHQIPIRSNGQNGVAARVLAVVLKEADRLDGKTPMERAIFNGSQWKIWVTQHRQADVLLRRLETDGLRRSDMIRHINLIQRTF